MGRSAAGVNAIRLQEDDEIAGMDVIANPAADLLVVTERGYGKRTPLDEYSAQARYGQGVRTLARNEKTGPVIAARTVEPGDLLTLITVAGMALRTEVDNISRIGRNTQGVQLMKMAEGDTIASIALFDDARRREREEAMDAEIASFGEPLPPDGRRPASYDGGGPDSPDDTELAGR
jgi:DNA gyrase subunit A